MMMPFDGKYQSIKVVACICMPALTISEILMFEILKA